MRGQTWARTPGDPYFLTERKSDGGLKTIQAKKDTRLLGATLQDNLRWASHVETGEEVRERCKKKVEK